MPGIKRDYKKIFRYLQMYGKGPHVVPLIQIARHYNGPERIDKYKEHIDNLIKDGKINPMEIYKIMEGV